MKWSGGSIAQVALGGAMIVGGTILSFTGAGAVVGVPLIAAGVGSTTNGVLNAKKDGDMEVAKNQAIKSANAAYKKEVIRSTNNALRAAASGETALRLSKSLAQSRLNNFEMEEKGQYRLARTLGKPEVH